MAKIHNTALVNPKAQIGENVEIGPFCIVGPNVKIGAGTRLISHCNLSGHTTLGKDNVIFPFASIGTEPQDHDYKGAISYLKIGDGNTFREGFTANVGTKEGTETIIGNKCYFMINSHVAHNCKIGNSVIVANSSGFSGYSEIGNNCVISGLCGTHQFVRLGRFVMMSGGSVTSLDIPPFMIADGRNGAIKAINLVGLKRNGFSENTIKSIKNMFKIFFRSGLNVTNALAKIKSDIEPIPEIIEFINFVESSKRGVGHCRTSGRRS